jgi:hypothetical protein
MQGMWDKENKWKCVLQENMALLSCNLPGNTAMAIKEFLTKYSIPVLPQPPCSPDLAPPHLFLSIQSIKETHI